jgi:predicted metal-dependent hydrolase
MTAQLNLGGISVEVVFKDIKNLHLSVYPPTGRVRISAPERMKLDTIRIYAISKLNWIKRQRTRLQGQERETPREFLDRESHYVWGRRYLLQIIETEAASSVQLCHGKMFLRVHPRTSDDSKHAIIGQFYRDQIKVVVPAILEKWEPVMGVTVDKLYLRLMKTKWGSCNPRTRAIRLNSELAKKPEECLEYVVVHEMIHFFERHHGDRFISLMDKFVPRWRHYREQLNRAPLGHETWSY